MGKQRAHRRKQKDTSKTAQIPSLGFRGGFIAKFKGTGIKIHIDLEGEDPSSELIGKSIRVALNGSKEPGEA